MLYQNEKSYKKWIVENYLEKNNPIGDLARDINQDQNFPNHSNSIKLLRYLRKIGACDNALRIFNTSFNI